MVAQEILREERRRGRPPIPTVSASDKAFLGRSSTVCISVLTFSSVLSCRSEELRRGGHAGGIDFWDCLYSVTPLSGEGSLCA